MERSRKRKPGSKRGRERNREEGWGVWARVATSAAASDPSKMWDTNARRGFPSYFFPLQIARMHHAEPGSHLEGSRVLEMMATPPARGGGAEERRKRRERIPPRYARYLFPHPRASVLRSLFFSLLSLSFSSPFLRLLPRLTHSNTPSLPPRRHHHPIAYLRYIYVFNGVFNAMTQKYTRRWPTP